MQTYFDGDRRLLHFSAESGGDAPDATPSPERRGLRLRTRLPERTDEVNEVAEKEAADRSDRVPPTVRRNLRGVTANPREAARLSARVATMQPKDMDQYINEIAARGPRNASESLLLVVLYLVKTLRDLKTDETAPIEGLNDSPAMQVFREFTRLDNGAKLVQIDSSRKFAVQPTDSFVASLSGDQKTALLEEATVGGRKVQIIKPTLTPTQVANLVRRPAGGPGAVPPGGPGAVPPGGPAASPGAVPPGAPGAVPPGGPAASPGAVPPGGPAAGPGAVPPGAPGAVPPGAPGAVPPGGPAAGPTEVADKELHDNIDRFDRMLREFNERGTRDLLSNKPFVDQLSVQLRAAISRGNDAKRIELTPVLRNVEKTARNLVAYERKQVSDNLGRQYSDLITNQSADGSNARQLRALLAQMIAANQSELQALNATDADNTVQRFIGISRDQRIADLQSAIQRNESQLEDPMRALRERRGQEVIAGVDQDYVTNRGDHYEISYGTLGISYNLRVKYTVDPASNQYRWMGSYDGGSNYVSMNDQRLVNYYKDEPVTNTIVQGLQRANRQTA